MNSNTKAYLVGGGIGSHTAYLIRDGDCPAREVEVVTSNRSTHEHGLQNKEINKEHREEVDIHSDDKNQRHTRTQVRAGGS